MNDVFLSTRELLKIPSSQAGEARVAARHNDTVYVGFAGAPAALYAIVSGELVDTAFDTSADAVTALQTASNGDLLLGGLRNGATALWRKSGATYTLLATCLDSTAEPVAIAENLRSGALWLLTADDLHWYAPGGATTEERLPPIRGWSTAVFSDDERGGTALVVQDERPVWVSKSGKLVVPRGFANQSDLPASGITQYLGNIWGIISATPEGEGGTSEPLQRITWFDEGDWMQPVPTEYSTEVYNWHQLTRLGDRLLAFGERTNGGPFAGVSTGRGFQVAVFQHRMLTITRCPHDTAHATVSGETLVCIARKSQDDAEAPPRRIIELSGEVETMPEPPSLPVNEDESTPTPGECGPMDVVLLIDTTGSMTGTIDSVTREINAILDDIASASDNDFRFGLIEFKNNCHVVFPLQVATDSAIRTLQTVLSGLRAGGGGAEASDLALLQAIHNISGPDVVNSSTGYFGTLGPFRATALKICILITDTLPGQLDDAPPDDWDSTNAYLAASDAAAAGIKICAIYAPSIADTEAIDVYLVPLMRHYATTTGGTYSRTRLGGRGTGAAIRQVVLGCGVKPPKTAPPSVPYVPPPRAISSEHEILTLEAQPGERIHAIQAFDASESRLLETYNKTASGIWCRIDSDEAPDDLDSYTERVPYSKRHIVSRPAQRVDVLFYLPEGETRYSVRCAVGVRN